MEGTVTIRGKTRKFTAERRREWGNPFDLFNGKDLTGWKPLGDAKKSKWKAEGGVLVNTGRGCNLETEKTFRDFKLHVEFRVPKHSNSGVYLRGRYEVQVEDSYGKKPNAGACGAIYSRISPSENASKPAGEWQSFDITLVGQYVTVVYNGKKIIDNQEIEGITGGALDVNEHEAGPIYIQGDHGSVDYRKIRIQTPPEASKTAKK
jgi:3-keto-disaccharide hydrolase